MPEHAIEVHDLSKRFGDHLAVDSLSMNIERGRVHGFIGPNGSGKTTAIRMICGLLEPTSGRVDVLGMDVAHDAEEIRKRVGYMTQRFSLYEDLDVFENFRFLGRIHGMSAAQIKTRTEELLELYNLEKIANRRVGPMSGGQKRRIALAAAVLTKPELLILDEPTSEVDPNTRRDMWSRFFELARDGTTIMVSTHLMDEAERCHRLTILDMGVKVADGTVEELESNLPASVLRVSGGEPSDWIAPLRGQPGIVSVTQVGLALRVLVSRDVGDPERAVREKLPADAVIEPAEASIEDVFVISTGGGQT